MNMERPARVLINSIPVEVPAGTTIIEAAEKVNVIIPRFCSSKESRHSGSCRICVVEVEGEEYLQTACNTPVREGMVVTTNSPLVRKTRRMVAELLISGHPDDCHSCTRLTPCGLRKLAAEVGIRERVFPWEGQGRAIDASHPSLVRNPEKCLLCGKCVFVCREVQTVDAIGFADRGRNTEVASGAPSGMIDSPCVGCGQCILVCPTGALSDSTDPDAIWSVLADQGKFVVAQVAPSTRATLGEEFGFKAGTNVAGKIVSALRRLGFRKVFDTTFAADLVAVEEAHELLARLEKSWAQPDGTPESAFGLGLPLMTSSSPAWVKFLEHFYPSLLPLLSTCKSPQQVAGALTKTHLAEGMGIDPGSMVVFSVMPCTAKKFEATRPEMVVSGMREVDFVLTNRELARLIREAGIDFANLPEEDFDDPMGVSSGGGDIFGVSGGVLEAALRVLAGLVSTGEPPSLEFRELRGFKDVKTAILQFENRSLHVAVASGLGPARELVEGLVSGKGPKFDYIEVMACPGGCIGGGGQISAGNFEVQARRAATLYAQDRGKPVRNPADNPFIKALYKDFLKKPNSPKAVSLLHTRFVARSRVW